jgi:hypothetical protein
VAWLRVDGFLDCDVRAAVGDQLATAAQVNNLPTSGDGVEMGMTGGVSVNGTGVVCVCNMMRGLIAVRQGYGGRVGKVSKATNMRSIISPAFSEERFSPAGLDNL